MYYKMQASVRLRRCGADGDPEQKTAAAAILYTAPPEAPWTKQQAEKSSGQILEEICGIRPDEKLYSNIMNEIYFLLSCGFPSETSGCRKLY